MARNLPAPVPPNRPPPNDGTLYRLRLRDDDTVIFGDKLTYPEASRLRDLVTSQRRNQGKQMVIEPMEDPAVELAADDLSVPEAAGAPTAPPPAHAGPEYHVASAMETTITTDGVIAKIPPGHQLLVDGQERPVPTAVVKGNVVVCRSLHPAVAASRAAANEAVTAVIKERKVPVDVTIRKPAARRAPPPRDITLSNRPTVVRLGNVVAGPPKPLPSPLKVAPLEDGEPLADDALTDADLPDLASDLGGGASDADVEHARKQAERERGG